MIIKPYTGKILELDAITAEEIINANYALAAGIPRLLIWDTRGCEVLVDPEARNLFVTSEKTAIYRKALAFVVDSLAIRMSAKFFMNVNAPNLPAAIFESVEEAKAWLLTKK